MSTNDVEQVLGHYASECQARHTEWLGSAGGMSGAQFWRVAAPRGTLVLRRWPKEHPTLDRLRFIHAVLAHAAKGGIAFVPVPIPTVRDETCIPYAGHLWELAPWLPGVADYLHSRTVGKLRAALTALAQFHVATADFPLSDQVRDSGTVPAITRRLARLRALVEGEMAQFIHALTESNWPELVPLARQFLEVLPRAVPRAMAELEPLTMLPTPRQVCIRDIWHDHVLFTGEQVTGLIDFGALDYDTPATDIARLLGSLAGDDAKAWQTGIAAYSAVRPLSDLEIRMAKVLDTSGSIIAGCNWIRWIYLEDRYFENRQQVIDRFRGCVNRVLWSLP